ncbi:MAG TPA: FAD-dependent oxidoreductase [Gemmatimonadales bacterium]
MRIAIVGGGIAGLVAAHLLHPDHDITLFEANACLGGHTHTVPVATPAGEWPVDTGFIVYNERNYPAFTALLARLGVATQPTSMSFSVRSDAGGFEYNGASLNRLFGQRANLLRPSFYRMASDILRFGRHAPLAIRDGAAEATLGEYARAAGYSDRFLAHYLVPMASALWSQPQQRVLEMPLVFLVQFLERHGMLRVNGRPQWRVVRGGSQRYVEALIRPFASQIRLGWTVRRVRRTPHGVSVDAEPFDEVVLACHADQALALLEDPTPAEREILSAIPYQANEVVLHTDPSLLPRRRQLWAAWNYHLDRDPSAPAAVTYNMNILQTLESPETFCVTLNRAAAVAPDRVIRRLTYHHPVFTTAGVRAQTRYLEISGRHHTHYCGAYWGNGFHEDGVASADRAARAIGARA